MGKDLFKKPQMVLEAAQMQKGLMWILEIMVFVAVFYVANMAMMVILLPGELVLMFTDPSYLSAIRSGDEASAIEIGEKLISSNGFMILMLISEILMILVACLFCKCIQKRRMATLGFFKKGIFKEYIIGLVVGFAMFSLAVLMAVVTGAIEFNGLSDAFSPGLFVLFLIGFMIQGMAEEVLCRGYFMISYARRYPVYAAIIANSLVFAALHLTNSGITVLSFVNLTLFGIFASVYFIKRGNLWGIGALHSIWNLVQGNFYGIKVSGMDVTNSFLSSTMVEGKELFNGGDFGLEGSICVTIVLVVATVIMFFTKTNEKDYPPMPEKLKQKLEMEKQRQMQLQMQAQMQMQMQMQMNAQRMNMPYGQPMMGGQPMGQPMPPQYGQPMYNQTVPPMNIQPMNGQVPQYSQSMNGQLMGQQQVTSQQEFVPPQSELTQQESEPVEKNID